jgi:hypothetical protein
MSDVASEHYLRAYKVVLSYIHLALGFAFLAYGRSVSPLRHRHRATKPKSHRNGRTTAPLRHRPQHYAPTAPYCSIVTPRHQTTTSTTSSTSSTSSTAAFDALECRRPSIVTVTVTVTVTITRLLARILDGGSKPSSRITNFTMVVFGTMLLKATVVSTTQLLCPETWQLAYTVYPHLIFTVPDLTPAIYLLWIWSGSSSRWLKDLHIKQKIRDQIAKVRTAFADGTEEVRNSFRWGWASTAPTSPAPILLCIDLIVLRIPTSPHP